jgi:hypothetical protein
MALAVRALGAKVDDLVEEQRYVLGMLLAREDRRMGRLLLPLAVEIVGGSMFTGPGLLAASRNDRTAAGKARREVLADLLADVGSLRAFGKLLARLEGKPLSGYRLVPAGEVSEGLRWRIERVSGVE